MVTSGEKNVKICQAAFNCDTAVIAMDFQKNLPLSLTGVSQEYYKRQLWLHNFCIHDNMHNCATMYLYAEHYAAKGPNEVISCLNHYITGLPAHITKLHIFADNCFSQNKNRYLIMYLHAISNCLLSEIHVHFPLPGHSRMPCDCDFGRIEKKRRRKNKVVQPSEWVKLIAAADHDRPFTIVHVEHLVTDNMLPDGNAVIKVKDYKAAYKPFL